GNILDVISAQRRRDVEEASRQTPTAQLEAQLSSAPAVLDFAGNIATDVDVPRQAHAYASAGAATISVLTEPTWFKGTLKDMRAAREAVEGMSDRPAILRKDFLVDRYQVLEARVYGADTCLLIVAILDDATLGDLLEYARSLDMEPLVEVATPTELQRALAVGAKIIGINNRNLKDFTVNNDTTRAIMETMGGARPEGLLFCALSGIKTRADAQAYQSVGCDAVLVGESLMRAASPGALIQSLRGMATTDPLVKICGLRDVETTDATLRLGADMVGLVFAPKSKRLVDVATARSIAQRVTKSRHSAHVAALRQQILAAQSEENGIAAWQARAQLLREMTAHRPLVVGVFANQPPAEVKRIADEVGLDVIQLSGTEGLDAAKDYAGYLVWKAVHVGAGDTGESLLSAAEAIPSASRAHALLLDTKSPLALGGTGGSFDWDIAANLAKLGMPFFLAGGLDPANVAQAVTKVQPMGLDVSSGVEADGVKSLDKIGAFVRAAK
ncbi:uncharacterized protein MONBRDRAFT_903, partial [Monosiga brevicollis MX1]